MLQVQGMGLRGAGLSGRAGGVWGGNGQRRPPRPGLAVRISRYRAQGIPPISISRLLRGSEEYFPRGLAGFHPAAGKHGSVSRSPASLFLSSRLRPPRSACTSCRTSPPPTSCISFLSISAVRRVSRTRRGGTRPACAHDPGASGTAPAMGSTRGAAGTMHRVPAHPAHPLPSRELFLGCPGPAKPVPRC